MEIFWRRDNTTEMTTKNSKCHIYIIDKALGRIWENSNFERKFTVGQMSFHTAYNAEILCDRTGINIDTRLQHLILRNCYNHPITFLNSQLPATERQNTLPAKALGFSESLNC